ncbi:MAG: anti-sigma factor [Dehalococcoidia bacterium]
MNAVIPACPDLGVWRAWLDQEPAEAGLDLQAHLHTCPDCRALVGDLRENAGMAATLVRSLDQTMTPAPAAVTLAQVRLRMARMGNQPAPVASTPPVSRFRRWRVAVAGMAAALALIAFAVTPPGREVTAQIMSQFRSERFEAVPLTAVQLENLAKTLAQLEQVGTVEGVEALGNGAMEVDSVAEAEQLAGFALKQPDAATLPQGYDATPSTISVIPAATARFTFDDAKARAYFQSIGRAEVELPPRFDGASIVVNTPPVVLMLFTRDGASGPADFAIPLVVGQAGTLTVDAAGGVTLEELRDFLLDLPGLSPETVTQLRNIQDWQSTIPIPVPVDLVSWRRTTVAGGPGLALADTMGIGSVLIWQRDGFMHGVGGVGSPGDIQRIADGLR